MKMAVPDFKNLKIGNKEAQLLENIYIKVLS